MPLLSSPCFPIKKFQDCIPFHCTHPILCQSQEGEHVIFSICSTPEGWGKCHWKPSWVIMFILMGVVSSTVTIFLNPQGTSSGHWIARWVLKQHKNSPCGHFGHQMNKSMYDFFGSRCKSTFLQLSSEHQTLSYVGNSIYTVLFHTRNCCYLHLCPETHLPGILVSCQIYIESLIVGPKITKMTKL